MTWYLYSYETLLERIDGYLPDDSGSWIWFVEQAEDVIDEHWDGSAYHCTAHMFGVAGVALELAERTGLDDLQKFAVLIAGLMHDAGRRDQDDEDNIETACFLADMFIDRCVHDDLEAIINLKQLVHAGIYGTMYPPKYPIESDIAKILRDADFAATLTPEPVVKEIRQALADEMGVVQTDYSFVVGQGALLPATVEYYKEFGLDIELVS